MAGSSSSDFTTTRWSVVLCAGGGEAADGLKHAALKELCEDYWRPVYSFVLRSHAPEDARDLTQEFFARLLARGWLEGIEENGGRFRSLLVTMVKRFLVSEYRAAKAARRGGDRCAVEMDFDCLADEQSTGETPEAAFDRHWALTLIERAGARLRQEAEVSGKSELFQIAEGFLAEEVEPGAYEAAAVLAGMSKGGLAMVVHRLRRRWRELIRLEVAETLADRQELESELQHLMEALRG